MPAGCPNHCRDLQKIRFTHKNEGRHKVDLYILIAGKGAKSASAEIQGTCYQVESYHTIPHGIPKFSQTVEMKLPCQKIKKKENVTRSINVTRCQQ